MSILAPFFCKPEDLQMSTVPTPSMKAGNFAGVAAVFDPITTPPGSLNRARFPNDQIPQNRMDPAAVRLVNLYPDPNLPGLFNNFVFNPVKTQREDDFDARVDHHFSERSTFFVRFI
jgi:hypothetical protein